MLLINVDVRFLQGRNGEKMMMFGRLVEKVLGGIKPSESRESYYSRCLEKSLPQLQDDFLKLSHDNPSLDYTGVFAKLLLNIIYPAIAKQDNGIASRAFFNFLRDNDTLPIQMQLSELELLSVCELLANFYLGFTAFNSKASEILSVIEKKFSSGLFAQARLLLKIFDTDDETKLNNERNLYYEEMITRLSAQHPLCKPTVEDFYPIFEKERIDDEEICRITKCYSASCDLNLLINVTDLNELEAVKRYSETLPESVQKDLVDIIPVKRWTRLGSLKGETPFAQVKRYVEDRESMRRFIQAKLKMCYFLLLASGKTGYEWYIFAFTKWCKDVFDVDAMELLPFIHKSGILEATSLAEILEIAVDRFFSPRFPAVIFNESEIEDAMQNALKHIGTMTISTLPAGQFNFAAFVLDELLPFEYEDPAFAFRVFELL